MEKVAYIKEFEVPVLFKYPPSRVAIGMGGPLLIYFAFVLPVRSFGLFSLLEIAILLTIHFTLLGLLVHLINKRFPSRIQFEAGQIQFDRFLGGKFQIPYENLEAILDTPYATVFAARGGQKLIFVPVQTYRMKDFQNVLEIIQTSIQTEPT